jgi:hypothetical protein
MYEVVHEEIRFDFEFGLRFSMVLGGFERDGNRRWGDWKLALCDFEIENHLWSTDFRL